MNVLIVPMFALSRMGGPWSRAQAIAAAFENAGHHVVLGISDDGNCIDPCVSDTCRLPVPAPLGLPMGISSRTFPIAQKLGIAGRKPVHSFEEVLWLTGALSYGYERESVEAICDVIERRSIDTVYSEYSLPTIIAAQTCGIPAFGSFSYTTQASYASNPAKAKGLRKLLGELGLPTPASALGVFDWLDRRFVPSCHRLEPIDDAKTELVGFLRNPPAAETGERDCILVYLGAGSIPQRLVERTVLEAFEDYEGAVYVAGCETERQQGVVRFASRFDFSQLLPKACCFVHHGGQNSTMDALAYGTPQVIAPGQVFERRYNAESIERTGAGIKLESFDAETLRYACLRVIGDHSFAESASALHRELAAGGGATRIVEVVEQAISVSQ